jgi:hypothetical protein
MLFGIGRKKEQDAQPAATLSPEAAALLHQMTPQNNGGDDGDMAGRAPNAPSNAEMTLARTNCALAARRAPNSGAPKSTSQRYHRKQKKHG